MIKINLGHGDVRMENGQLRDNLSRLWCDCGQPAVKHLENELPQYQFVCTKHAGEDKSE